MITRYNLSGLLATCYAIALCSCGGGGHDGKMKESFTKADSLTETYLALQDSMLQSWNIMINDDNKKIKAMHNILHELKLTSPEEQETLHSYEDRLDQLIRLRYTQKTLANADVVEEYDFASNSLVTELVSLAESRKEFPYNTTLQRLVEDILAADQRINNYRAQYDMIVLEYNDFVSENHAMLKEVEDNGKLDKKPLFQMASDEE